MGIKNKIFSGNLYFVTMTVIDWVDAITNDPQSYAIAQKLSKVFMFANFNQILIASDPDKYLVLHYRIQDFNDQQLGNLFFSIKDTVYQIPQSLGSCRVTNMSLASCQVLDYT